MVNMKQSRKSDTPIAESDEPEYPYGLRISLDSDALAKLGLTELPKVGTAMTLQARVEVVAVSQYEQKDETNRSVELQVTDMELDTPRDAKNLYPNSGMN